MIAAAMPSPIAHALGGAAVAWLADRTPRRPAADARVATACAVLAALPDADLLLPMAHRTVTHSLAAVAIVFFIVSIAGAVTGKVTVRVALICAAAYASHLLLDWLQADPTPPFGIQVLWPFSPAWVISGVNVFRATERRHLLDAVVMKRNFVAAVQEVAIMAPIAATAYLARAGALSRPRAGPRARS
jgi:membrane-bound metal-dependent hydrolase YbcI (DUF457 family)